MVKFFDKEIKVRITNQQLELIKKLVKRVRLENQELKYQNKNHFIRIAINRLLKEEGYGEYKQ